MVAKKLNDAIIEGMIAFAVFFGILPILQTFTGWNDTAGYATLIKTLVPLGIGLFVAMSAFGKTSLRR